MKRLLILLLLLYGMTLQAQSLRVLESNLYYDSRQHQLVTGIVICELTPDTYCHCRPEGDSAVIDILLYDPATGEWIPFLTVYTVHRDGSDIIIDDTVWEYGNSLNDTAWIYDPGSYRSMRIPLNSRQMLAAVTAGYRPVLLEYDPTATPQKRTLIDIEISEAEFSDALMRADQENWIRSDRPLDADDTAAVIAWLQKCNYYSPDILNIVLEECGGVFYEGLETIEIAVGDYCVTRLKHDTVDMKDCSMSVSTAGNLFGGINMEWGAGDADLPAYVYVYPMLPDFEHVGQPYIYQTTPAWEPSGRPHRDFWGPHGWFYVEGYDRNQDKYVYHRLHIQ